MLDLFLRVWLEGLGLAPRTARQVALAVLLAGVLVIAVLSAWLTRRLFLPVLHAMVRHNRISWDDPLVETRFLSRLSWFAPLAVAHLAVEIMLPGQGPVEDLARRLLQVAFVVTGVLCVTSLLTAINELYKKLRGLRGSPLRGFVDIGRIMAYILGAVFVLSILTGRSPWGLLSLMGGVTAVTMLVFKDTILGFVASLQLIGTDMVRVGDWIEVPKYGADGDVIDLSIHTVRVQNFDKTITTIPTYALVAGSFKNWRGMQEAGGRRIKRAIHIDIHSIRFLEPEELMELRRIEVLRGYIDTRQAEIERYNLVREVDTASPLNGRRQTNIGLFRAYALAWLRTRADLRTDMTFLVRQLAPGEHGLPLEIYVFCNDTNWVRYEAVQADIFDHLLAALPEFGLRAFQYPTLVPERGVFEKM